MLQAGTAEDRNLPANIVAVLEDFEELFKGTEGLPPPRKYDHTIELKEGANIPNLRSYMYLHFQKNENGKWQIC